MIGSASETVPDYNPRPVCGPCDRAGSAAVDHRGVRPHRRTVRRYYCPNCNAALGKTVSSDDGLIGAAVWPDAEAGFPQTKPTVVAA